MMRYTVVVTPEPDGSEFNVTVPALTGCFTWGASIEEAVAHARDAIAGHVAALVETGQPVPIEGEADAPSINSVEIEVDAA